MPSLCTARLEAWAAWKVGRDGYRQVTRLLTIDGLLVLPTFTYDTEEFDPATIPAGTDAIAEAGCSWPGVVRSWPISFGGRYQIRRRSLVRQASYAAECHDAGLTIGSTGPAAAARFVLGVKHISNSMVHLGESHAQLRYLYILFVPDCAAKAVVKTPLGKEMVHIKELTGCRTAFGVVELPLDLRGLIRCGRIGEAVSQPAHAPAQYYRHHTWNSESRSGGPAVRKSELLP